MNLGQALLGNNERENESLAREALNKYGPDGLEGGINKQNMRISNGIFSLPHTFTGFSGMNIPDNTTSDPENVYAKGGIIKGPGTGTSDSIDAELEVNGAIIPANIVKLFGKPFFDKLVAGAPKPKGQNAEVDAKVSNGEYHLTPEQVKYLSKDAVNKLIAINEGMEQPGMMDKSESQSPKLQGYADGGVVNPAWGSTSPAPDYKNQPKKDAPVIEPAPQSLRERLFGGGLDKLNNALSGKQPEDKEGYADGGIVNDGLQRRINNVITRDNTGVKAQPVVTPTLQDRMPAAQANAQVQNDALRAKINAPEPSLDLRNRMGMPPVQTPPTLQQRMPVAQANMQGQNQVMRNNGFGANRMVQPPSLVPALSVAPRALSATSVDAGTVSNAANDLVSNYDYQHPELKSKMQAMFPKPGYAKGGIIDDPNNYNPATAGTGLQSKDLIDHHLIRDNMTAKGQGFYGNINGSSNPNAPTVSEYSIGVGVPKDYRHIPGLNPSVAPLQLDGHQKYYDAPSIAPGLNGQQLSDVAGGNVSNDVYNNAEKSAADRQWAGKPVFANPLERVATYPRQGKPGYARGGVIPGPRVTLGDNPDLFDKLQLAKTNIVPQYGFNGDPGPVQRTMPAGYGRSVTGDLNSMGTEKTIHQQIQGRTPSSAAVTSGESPVIPRNSLGSTSVIPESLSRPADKLPAIINGEGVVTQPTYTTDRIVSQQYRPTTDTTTNVNNRSAEMKVAGASNPSIPEGQNLATLNKGLATVNGEGVNVSQPEAPQKVRQMIDGDNPNAKGRKYSNEGANWKAKQAAQAARYNNAGKATATTTKSIVKPSGFPSVVGATVGALAAYKPIKQFGGMVADTYNESGITGVGDALAGTASGIANNPKRYLVDPFVEPVTDAYKDARSHGLNRVASGAYAAGNMLLDAGKGVYEGAKELGGDIFGASPNPYLKQTSTTPPNLAQTQPGNTAPGTVKVPLPEQQLSNLATGRDAGLEPVGASASGATLTRPRTLQDVAQNKLDNENRNKWIAANAAREDALQAPVLQSGANQNNLLSDRAKILEQNLEFNRRQGALAANQQANSQPITAPVYDDTGAADRELAAKHGLEYAQLAQQQKQFDTTTRVGSATAETTANKPIYTAPQKALDANGNTIQTPGTVYDPMTGKIKYLNNEQEMPDISSYAPEQIKTRNENAQKILANMGNYDDTKVNDALKWMQYIKANSLGIK